MILDIFFVLFFILLGFMVPRWLRISVKDRQIVYYLWVFHLVMAIAYFFFTTADTGSDSMRFWRTSQQLDINAALATFFERQGTYIMFILVYPLSKILGISYFTGTILFSLLGFIGLALFVKIALKFVPYNYKIFSVSLYPCLFFFPNLHFWSVGVGKDTLVFLAIAIFCASMMNVRKNIGWILLSLMLSFIIRPHITLYLLASFGFVTLFSGKLQNYIKIILSGTMIVGLIVILPTVLEFAKIEELSTESLSEFATTKSVNLSQTHTGSSIDVSNMSYPLKVFSFLFRPTFTDINGIPALVAAFENLILLILFIRTLQFSFVTTYKQADLVLKGMAVLLLIGTLTFSLTLGNLGIMLRMRNMFLPGLIIFILWSYSNRAAKTRLKN